jgi:hypothetical protein
MHNITPEQASAELKAVRSYMKFVWLIQRMDMAGLWLRSKRGKKRAIDFRSWNDGLEYLYDDGVSVGSCKYKNLSRVLEVY